MDYKLTMFEMIIRESLKDEYNGKSPILAYDAEEVCEFLKFIIGNPDSWFNKNKERILENSDLKEQLWFQVESGMTRIEKSCLKANTNVPLNIFEAFNKFSEDFSPNPNLTQEEVKAMDGRNKDREDCIDFCIN